MLQRARARFAMAADGVAVEVGDVLSLDGDSWRVVEASIGDAIAVEAVCAGNSINITLTAAAPVAPPGGTGKVEPDVILVDGPPLPGQEEDLRPIGFAFADPWTGAVKFSAGADAIAMTVRGVIERRCVVGRLISGLYPHVSGRWQDASIWVTVGGPLSSKTEAAVLNGANSALVETDAS